MVSGRCFSPPTPTNFNHDNIRKYCNRPYDSVGVMDTAIIRNWNHVVAPDDVVYHLGDVGVWYGLYLDSLPELLNRLNGKICLIKGNHDKKFNNDIRKRFEWIKEYKMIEIPDEEIGTRQKIVLFHYPIDQWDCAFHGSWHLHGHSHGTVPPNNPRRVDVGVDSNNFTPLSYDDVKLIITKRVLSNDNNSSYTKT